MIKFFCIYASFIKQQIKSLIEYKFDFCMGMIGLAIYQTGSFLLLFAVFTEIKTIGSYSFNEILLIYGYSQIVRGLDHLYNDNIWSVAWTSVRDGRFSQYLLRPVNPIIHIIMEKVQFDGIGELVIGIIVFIYAKGMLGLHFGLTGWIIFVIFLAVGLIIYFSIKLLCSAVAFWTASSGELLLIMYEVNSFAKYPLDIYSSRILQFILVYLLPFAMVSYFPMAYFIRDNTYISNVIGFNTGSKYTLVAFAVLIAAGFLAISLSVWKAGLRRYEATGT